LNLREYVEDLRAVDALEVSGAGVVASYVLHGGVLTGKYSGKAEPGRMATQLDDPELAPALRAAGDLTVLAQRLATSPAALAIAFALANDRVSSVLFGSTTVEQLIENVSAVALLDRLSPTELAALRSIGT
jgi:aryl-alcohol dehydrogenase-like predicted oxidoreductase